MESSAVIDGDYRYILRRRWGDGPTCTFIMLNPSTADATEDDPTIRRCIAFAIREGCGSLTVVNLFAYRATSPKDMKAAEYPIGAMNNGWIQHAAAEADGPIIAAWGNHGAFQGRSDTVRHHLTKCSASQPLCFGVTKAGEPKHPLYLAADTPLVPLPPTSEEA